MGFQENLKKARKKKGITQKELSELINVSQKDISRWENGERTPNLESLRKICINLEISADELLEIKL